MAEIELFLTLHIYELINIESLMRPGKTEVKFCGIKKLAEGI